MTLTMLRTIGAWCCLAATAVLLPASTAQADAIPSQLAAAPDLATARIALSDALALERLAGLGFATTDAKRLVAATRAARVEALLNHICRVTDVEGQLRVSLDADILHTVIQRVRYSLTRHGLMNRRSWQVSRRGCISRREYLHAPVWRSSVWPPGRPRC